MVLVEVQGGPAAGRGEELPLLLPGNTTSVTSSCSCPNVSHAPAALLQLLRGGSAETLRSLHLQNDPALYLFTREGATAAVSSSPSSSAAGLEQKKRQEHVCVQTSNNDRSAHRAVASALAAIGFSPEEVKAIHQVLASILLLVTPHSGLKEP